MNKFTAGDTIRHITGNKKGIIYNLVAGVKDGWEEDVYSTSFINKDAAEIGFSEQGLVLTRMILIEKTTEEHAFL